MLQKMIDLFLGRHVRIVDMMEIGVRSAEGVCGEIRDEPDFPGRFKIILNDDGDDNFYWFVVADNEGVADINPRSVKGKSLIGGWVRIIELVSEEVVPAETIPPSTNPHILLC